MIYKCRTFCNSLNLFMYAIFIGYYNTTVISTTNIFTISGGRCCAHLCNYQPYVYSCRYNCIKHLKEQNYLLSKYYHNYKILNKYIVY